MRGNLNFTEERKHGMHCANERAPLWRRCLEDGGSYLSCSSAYIVAYVAIAGFHGTRIGDEYYVKVGPRGARSFVEALSVR